MVSIGPQGRFEPGFDFRVRGFLSFAKCLSSNFKFRCATGLGAVRLPLPATSPSRSGIRKHRTSGNTYEYDCRTKRCRVDFNWMRRTSGREKVGAHIETSVLKSILPIYFIKGHWICHKLVHQFHVQGMSRLKV